MNQTDDSPVSTACRLFVDARSAMAPEYPRYAAAVVNIDFLGTLNSMREVLQKHDGSHFAVPFPVQWDADFLSSDRSELCLGDGHFFFRSYSPSDNRHIETAPVNMSEFTFALGRGDLEMYCGVLNPESLYKHQLEEAYEDAVEFED